MSNTIWKGFERLIGRAMGTDRNMGSGRINRTDRGEERPGDIVCPEEWDALIECKTRKLYPKSGIYPRAEDTMKEAADLGKKNWFHFERKNGSKKIMVLATSEEWIVKICEFLGEQLEGDN